MTDLCALMLFSSKQDILKSLNSLSFLDTFVILNIGATKEECQSASQWATDNKKKMFMKKNKFINFEDARNKLLSYADSVAKESWFLMIDYEDEMIGNVDCLKDILTKAIAKKGDGILFKQIHKYGEQTVKTEFCKCIRARSDWKYIGVINEVPEKPDAVLLRAEELNEDAPYIHNDKSKVNMDNLVRDYRILVQEVSKTADSRNVFHLARTCEALKAIDEARKYYSMRIEQGGFFEELFYSYLSLGMIHKFLGHKQTAIHYFLEAYEVDERVEPLVEIANIYFETKEWNKALIFLECAIWLKEPKQGERQLLVDLDQYAYTRWHLTGIAAYYVGEYALGKMACKKAISRSRTKEEKDMNQKNLKFYLDAQPVQ